MNKNIRRKNSTLPVTDDMKYNFSIGFKAIFLSGYIDRERMVRSGYLEFPCGLFGISLWVFVHRKRMARFGCLEFP